MRPFHLNEEEIRHIEELRSLLESQRTAICRTVHELAAYRPAVAQPSPNVLAFPYRRTS